MMSFWNSTLYGPFCFVIGVAALVVSGCNLENEQAKKDAGGPVQQLPLRVLVVEDEGLAEVIDREWNARPGGQCKVEQTTPQKLFETGSRRLGADVVIYPSALLGELAERDLIVPLRDNLVDDSAFARRDILDSTRLHEINWGGELYAIPFGSPQLVLLYRKDIFESLGMTPPDTWQAYAELLDQLSDRQTVGPLASAAEEPWNATAEPTGAGWAGQLLLARSAAYARHRSQYSTLFNFNSMKPLIDGPPFVRALEELVAASKHSAPDSRTPTDARRLFLSGRTAMAITWPNRAEDVSPEAPSDKAAQIGVAELPGARDVYNFRTEQWKERSQSESGRVPLLGIDGRLGSVTKECRRSPSAFSMLFALAGRELGSDVSSASKHTTLFRESQLANASLWVDRAFDSEAASEYGDVVQATQSQGASLISVRVPGRSQYLDALDRAVQSALAGDVTPAAALKAAAKEWHTITQSIGIEQQRAAYSRSLGLQP